MGFNRDAGHPCPAPRCGLTVPPGKLMCRTHWGMVPKPLRDAVYAAWAGGLGAGSPRHREAIAAAVEAVCERLAGADP